MCNSLVLNGLAVLGIAALIGLMLYVFYKLAEIVDDYRLIKDNLGYARRDVAELHKRVSTLDFTEVPGVKSTATELAIRLNRVENHLGNAEDNTEKLLVTKKAKKS